jgi:hypothetical protein
MGRIAVRFQTLVERLHGPTAAFGPWLRAEDLNRRAARTLSLAAFLGVSELPTPCSAVSA